MRLPHAAQHNAIRWSPQSATWAPRPLGSAAAASGLTPEQALALHADLARAISAGISFSSNLQLVYLVTPTYAELPRPNWVK